MSEWDQRLLCADGACVGVISDDGTCKVCGRAAPNWAEPRKRGLLVEEPDAVEDAGPIDTKSLIAGDPGWNRRSLCPDGACVGLIGPDGLCKVCGKAGVADDEDDDLVDEDDGDEGEDEEDDGEYDDDEGDEEEDDEEEDEEDKEAGDGRAVAAAPEWAERKLCPDDACIGLIGDSGACKVCGKRAA